MSMQIARKVVAYFHEIKKPASDVEKLTQREQEILALLALLTGDKGMSARRSAVFVTLALIGTVRSSEVL